MVQPTQTDPQFKLRLPAELKERISALAARNNRSINAEIVNALEFQMAGEDFADEMELILGNKQMSSAEYESAAEHAIMRKVTKALHESQKQLAESKAQNAEVHNLIAQLKSVLEDAARTMKELKK